MKIEVKKLELENFQGIGGLKVDFSDVTEIYGDNATGKTTIANAFRWLLFDKDAQDRKDFSVKTLDKDNNAIPGLDHSVTGLLSISGRSLSLKKTLREKWTKQRGSSEKTFTGHETSYEIDDIPVLKEEYDERIGRILYEPTFKMLTDPLYFSEKLKWEDRRDILLNLVGGITNEQVLDVNPSFREILAGEDDIMLFKRSLRARKRKANEAIKSIPARIDELHNTKVEIDQPKLERELNKLSKRVAAIDENLAHMVDPNKERKELAKKVSGKLDRITEIEQLDRDERRKTMTILREKVDVAKAEADAIYYQAQDKEGDVTILKNKIEKKQNWVKDLAATYDAEKAKVFVLDEDELKCPTCDRAYDDIETEKADQLTRFNNAKGKKLTAISEEGEQLNLDINNHKTEIAALGVTFSKLTTERDALLKAEAAEQKVLEDYECKEVEKSSGQKRLEEEIKKLEEEINAPILDDPRDAILHEKRTITGRVDEINQELYAVVSNENAEKRINELKEQERKLADEIAALEQKEFTCEQFIVSKVELVEDKINRMFLLVNFKMFKTRINGAVDEVCEALIDGVPFRDANSGARINAGLDIIHTLAKHEDVTAPIFVDNAESVTRLHPTDSQLIKNFVSKRDKKLRIIQKESNHD